MRNILCYICRAKFGEIHHFILNEIIFYQLIYHFIIPTHFEITSKEGFCTATQVLFLKHIFSQLKRTVEKANSIHSLLHPFLLVMHIQFFLGKYPLYLQCSGQIPDFCNYTQPDYIIARFFFSLFWRGNPLSLSCLGVLQVLLLSAGAEREGISKCGEVEDSLC